MGNQATSSWPKPLVKDLSRKCIVRLRRAPPGFCLSMIPGFTLGTRPLFKYTTCWQQQSRVSHMEPCGGEPVRLWQAEIKQIKHHVQILPRMSSLMCLFLIVSVKRRSDGTLKHSQTSDSSWTGLTLMLTISQLSLCLQRLKNATERALSLMRHFKEDSALLFILSHVKRMRLVWLILFLSAEVEWYPNEYPLRW